MISFSRDFLSLPPIQEVETNAILKRLSYVMASLGRLNGEIKNIPNPKMLLSTLTLMESKESAEIENIVTTQDAMYKSGLGMKFVGDAASKEVMTYAHALNKGVELIKRSGVLSLNNILQVQEIVEGNSAGFRKVPGVSLENAVTKEAVYMPPSPDIVITLMSDLEKLMNNDNLYDVHPIIKMALIHYQFETIHPFYDGNGRTGRIINILYLMHQGLLDAQILYLSRYINQRRQDYYRLLQNIHERRDFTAWIDFVVSGVKESADDAINLIGEIRTLLEEVRREIQSRRKRIYSHDLLNHIFSSPYTKINYVKEALRVTRPTAVTYLDTLADDGILSKHRHGRENYYVNDRIINLLVTHPHGGKTEDVWRER